MTAEVLKYTLEQVEALELAPGSEHDNLEGWIPELAGEDDLRLALEKAFDYRGDVQYFTPSAPEKRKVSYAEIARLAFGKDRAAGKHWEDWVKKYNERKAAGEQGIALHPEALD
jgi:hypothetical protein